MFDYPSTYHNGTEYPITSSLVRLKRTRRDADIEVDWNNNDNEQNDEEPAASFSSKKGSAQLDPMSEALVCRADIAKLKRGYYEGLYAELARVTRIARGFERNKKSWARFVAHSFWVDGRKQDRPHVRHEKSKIAFVTRFVFKPRSKNQFKRTSKFSGVLEFLLGKGVKPERLARELKKRGGIEKIHQLATKRRARHKGTDRISADHPDVAAERAGGPVMSWNRKMRKTANELEVGSRVRLECEVVAEDDGAITLKVTGVTKRKFSRKKAPSQ